jgi:hypothetical protein
VPTWHVLHPRHIAAFGAWFTAFAATEPEVNVPASHVLQLRLVVADAAGGMTYSPATQLRCVAQLD